MPRYRENNLMVPFSMFCPGISQNKKHHHLTLYQGQVWRSKVYQDLCDDNILYISGLDRKWTSRFDPINGDWIQTEYNGYLYVPPLPSIYRFKRDETMIPWHGEILQSFFELTRITHLAFQSLSLFKRNITIDERKTYQMTIGNHIMPYTFHHELFMPPNTYKPEYIWTKEGFQT